MKSETLDATLAAVGSKTAYTGASMTGVGWFLSNEFFGLAGLCIGVIGLCINWHFKTKADARERQADERDKLEYEARMRQLGEKP